MIQLNRSKNKLSEEDEESGFVFSLDGSGASKHTAYPMGLVHDFYIYGMIKSHSEHMDLITTLNTAGENDIVNIYLNTPGGDLDATVSILHAMNRTKAVTFTHADGDVSSAGTLIFFSGENKIVNPYAIMMLHDASMGLLSGKVSETIKHVNCATSLIKKICYDVYIPYFTQDEVDDILSGHDYYCDADEVFRRLQVGEEIKRKTMEIEDLDEVEVKPKKKKAKHEKD